MNAPITKPDVHFWGQRWGDDRYVLHLRACLGVAMMDPFDRVTVSCLGHETR